MKGGPGQGEIARGAGPLPWEPASRDREEPNTAAEAKDARLWHRTQRRLSSCGSHIDNRSRCQVRPLTVFAAAITDEAQFRTVLLRLLQSGLPYTRRFATGLWNMEKTSSHFLKLMELPCSVNIR